MLLLEMGPGPKIRGPVLGPIIRIQIFGRQQWLNFGKLPNTCPNNCHNKSSLFGQDPLSMKCIPNSPFFTRTFRTTPSTVGLGL